MNFFQSRQQVHANAHQISEQYLKLIVIKKILQKF